MNPNIIVRRCLKTFKKSNKLFKDRKVERIINFFKMNLVSALTNTSPNKIESRIPNPKIRRNNTPILKCKTRIIFKFCRTKSQTSTVAVHKKNNTWKFRE